MTDHDAEMDATIAVLVETGISELFVDEDGEAASRTKADLSGVAMYRG